jgi:dipeptidyl aminopeptidase/acylaminoacyl peptidase
LISKSNVIQLLKGFSMRRTLFVTLVLIFASPVLGQTASPTAMNPASSSPTAPATAATPPAVGTAAPQRFFGLFVPLRTDSASLSPDGKFIAYSLREEGNLSVLIIEVDNPTKVRAKVTVATDETSTPTMDTETKEKTPARIRWMGWATPTRLIVETNANLATYIGEKWVNTSGALFAVDADGQNGRTLATPRDIADITPKMDLPPETENPDAILPPDAERPTQTETLPSNATATQINDAAFMAGSANNLPADNRSPRSPAFFDYIPGEPDWISVRSSGLNKYSLYKIHIHTGALRYGKSEVVVDDYTPLINRQGKQGAAIVNSLKDAFPHDYLVEKKSGLGRWAPLNKIAKIPAADFTLSPQNYLGERSFPVGFDEDPDVLYYASNVGRDTYGLYALNLKTGQRVGKPIESSNVDLVSAAPDGFLTANPLVFDRYTRQLIGLRFTSANRTAIWLKPECQEVQTTLETSFPGRSVDILEWDQTGARFLALIQSPTDSGSYCVFDRTTKKLFEFVRRAPWMTTANTPLVMNFNFPNPQGGKLSGMIAIPRAVRQKPIPIVVMCADEPWMRSTTDFHNQTNALAEMGFAVVQINVRGTWGFGVKHRRAAQDAFDEIQVQDIVTTIDELSKGLPLNPKRVAILGARRGGYLAFRALQLYPDRFRCAVGIEPTVNLAGWLAQSRWTSGAAGPALTRSFFGEKLLQENALVKNTDAIKKPIFILSYRGVDGGATSQSYIDAQNFGASLERREVPVKYFQLTTDYMRGLPNAHSETMRNIEDFLNENIYAYNVKLGETEVKDDDVKSAPPKK